MEQVDFDTLIDEIEHGRCILIIGPDIVDYGSKTFFECLCDYLKSDKQYNMMVEASPQYIFENEELFQPIHNKYINKLHNRIEKFYNSQIGFVAPLTQITQIPFHLIISLLPDSRLQQLFEQQAIKANYGYYPLQGPAEPVEMPTTELPLVYKLFGDFDNKYSIITFGHLFDFLSNIMGAKKLPDNIAKILGNAGSFLFLGVNFEKWHAQILLNKLISENDATIPASGRRNSGYEIRGRYAILQRQKTEDVYTFISNRLDVELLETTPQVFLNELYDACGERGILRKKGFKRTVFISYSSKDEEVAKEVERILLENRIGVVRDNSSGTAGQNIEQFIGTIKNLDGVILISSKDSLASQWVCKEIMATTECHKTLYKCHLDKSFLETSYWDEVKEKINTKLEGIASEIGRRGTDDIDDLMTAREDWRYFAKNIPQLIINLTRDFSKSLLPKDIDDTMQKLVQDILKGNGTK